MLLLVIDSIFAKIEHQPQYYEDGFCTIPEFMKDKPKFMKDENSRIYHGNTAPSPIPWQVQMVVNGWLFMCGGTILDSKTILTAAHCIRFEDPSVFQISAGLTHRTNLTGAQVKNTFCRIPSHLSHHVAV